MASFSGLAGKVRSITESDEFDLGSSSEGAGGGGMSRSNRAEAAFALQLYCFIKSEYPRCFGGATVGGSAVPPVAESASAADPGPPGEMQGPRLAHQVCKE